VSQNQTSDPCPTCESITVVANPIGAPPGTPTPPDNIPGGPWGWSNDDQNPRGGAYKGPKPPKGPRPSLTYDPDDDYWRLDDGYGNSQRYRGGSGDPISPEEAHPGNPQNPSPNVGPTGPIAIILCALFFCANPAY
jgi:hypothetical protein